MSQIRATTPADAFWTLDPFALVKPGDPWHSEIESHLKPSRYGLVVQLTRRLTPSPAAPPHVQVGIVGHKGTGKTTVVRKAMTDLAPRGIYPVYVDALASLDQADLSFADVILIVTNAVVAGLEEARVEIPSAESELVKLWFTEELLTETHRRELLGAVETEAKAFCRRGVTRSADREGDRSFQEPQRVPARDPAACRARPFRPGAAREPAPRCRQ